MTEQELIGTLNETSDSIRKFKQVLMEIQEQMYIFGALLKKANESLVPRLRGTDQAMDALKAQIALWENHRSGCLEQLAEYIVKNNVAVDAGLDEMVRLGVMPEWRNAAPNG